MSVYKRKTRDVWNILQYTGRQYGYEVVHCVETYREARQSAREYRDNQPEYAVKIKYSRERIEQHEQ